MKNTTTLENVTFGNRGRRWDFTVEKEGKQIYSYSTPTMPGGRETATKVARVINGAVKRSGTMDNLGRANVANIFHTASKAASRMVKH